MWGIRLTQVARVLWRDVGRAPSPAAGPLAGLPAGGRGHRPQRGPQVQGDRPTKAMPERLPESSRYPGAFIFALYCAANTPRIYPRFRRIPASSVAADFESVSRTA